MHDVIGWPQEKVIATLGQPDGKNVGRSWSEPPDPEKPHSSPKIVIVNCGGEIQEIGYVFGVIPQRIPALIPYERWIYENVQGQNWLLFMTQISATPVGSVPWRSPRPPEPRGLWQKLRSFVRGDRSRPPRLRSQRVPLETLKPSGPLVVAEVNFYPIGAVF